MRFPSRCCCAETQGLWFPGLHIVVGGGTGCSLKPWCGLPAPVKQETTTCILKMPSSPPELAAREKVGIGRWLTRSKQQQIGFADPLSLCFSSSGNWERSCSQPGLGTSPQLPSLHLYLFRLLLWCLEELSGGRKTATLLSSLNPEKLSQGKESYKGVWAGLRDWVQGSAVWRGPGEPPAPQLGLCTPQTGCPSPAPVVGSGLRQQQGDVGPAGALLCGPLGETLLWLSWSDAHSEPASGASVGGGGGL